MCVCGGGGGGGGGGGDSHMYLLPVERFACWLMSFVHYIHVELLAYVTIASFPGCVGGDKAAW